MTLHSKIDWVLAALDGHPRPGRARWLQAVMRHLARQIPRAGMYWRRP